MKLHTECKITTGLRPKVLATNNKFTNVVVPFLAVTDKQIIPSQMEVAPLHCTVDITQKRSLSKNTKEIENM